MTTNTETRMTAPAEARPAKPFQLELSCPMAANRPDNDDRCISTGCAWWDDYNTRCAMLSISFDLNDLSTAYCQQSGER